MNACAMAFSSHSINSGNGAAAGSGSMPNYEEVLTYIQAAYDELRMLPTVGGVSCSRDEASGNARLQFDLTVTDLHKVCVCVQNAFHEAIVRKLNSAQHNPEDLGLEVMQALVVALFDHAMGTQSESMYMLIANSLHYLSMLPLSKVNFALVVRDFFRSETYKLSKLVRRENDVRSEQLCDADEKRCVRYFALLFFCWQFLVVDESVLLESIEALLEDSAERDMAVLMRSASILSANFAYFAQNVLGQSKEQARVSALFTSDEFEAFWRNAIRVMKCKFEMRKLRLSVETELKVKLDAASLKMRMCTMASYANNFGYPSPQLDAGFDSHLDWNAVHPGAMLTSPLTHFSAQQSAMSYWPPPDNVKTSNSLGTFTNKSPNNFAAPSNSNATTLKKYCETSNLNPLNDVLLSATHKPDKNAISQNTFARLHEAEKKSAGSCARLESQKTLKAAAGDSLGFNRNPLSDTLNISFNSQLSTQLNALMADERNSEPSFGSEELESDGFESDSDDFKFNSTVIDKTTDKTSPPKSATTENDKLKRKLSHLFTKPIQRKEVGAAIRYVIHEILNLRWLNESNLFVVTDLIVEKACEVRENFRFFAILCRHLTNPSFMAEAIGRLGGSLSYANSATFGQLFPNLNAANAEATRKRLANSNSHAAPGSNTCTLSSFRFGDCLATRLAAKLSELITVAEDDSQCSPLELETARQKCECLAKFVATLDKMQILKQGVLNDLILKCFVRCTETSLVFVCTTLKTVSNKIDGWLADDVYNRLSRLAEERRNMLSIGLLDAMARLLDQYARRTRAKVDSVKKDGAPSHKSSNFAGLSNAAGAIVQYSPDGIPIAVLPLSSHDMRTQPIVSPSGASQFVPITNDSKQTHAGASSMSVKPVSVICTGATFTFGKPQQPFHIAVTNISDVLCADQKTADGSGSAQQNTQLSGAHPQTSLPSLIQSVARTTDSLANLQSAAKHRSATPIL